MARRLDDLRERKLEQHLPVLIHDLERMTVRIGPAAQQVKADVERGLMRAEISGLDIRILDADLIATAAFRAVQMEEIQRHGLASGDYRPEQPHTVRWTPNVEALQS